MSSGQNDHDLLVSIHAILESSLATQTKLEKKFEAHEAEDRKSFAAINRVIWMGLGALAALQIILTVIIGAHVHA